MDPLPGFVTTATPLMFFTGKGGVGKTSLATATALRLASPARPVLLVSTDIASDLDLMLGVPRSASPEPVPGAPGLSLLLLDPDAAAEAYRARVVEQMGDAPEAEKAQVREELSGACTTEIALFDTFAALLGAPLAAQGYAHILFDTAPTGHTLRLLRLPALWSGFLATNTRGASCLGPHSGLRMRQARFQAAHDALVDPARTTVVLVARSEPTALREAARTADELRAIGLTNQRLALNGVFTTSRPDDPVAAALDARGAAARAAMPTTLRALPTDLVPLRPFDTVGLPALRALLGGPPPPAAPAAPALPADPPLSACVDALAAAGPGLVMVMGKGGVGKTTIAAALAVGLVQRGHAVHLTTTDPAAHLADTLDGSLPGLTVARIDPHAETEAYIQRMMQQKGAALDEAGRALLLEDLQSPCTEEVAVFHAFAREVQRARGAIVVLDTAPTGHALLLMDATGAYHRQVKRHETSAGRLTTPLMRLQDPALTRVLLVTLPEPTPVRQAAELQADLRRAGITPWAWVLNQSLSAAGTRDPLLAARLAGEHRQRALLADGLAPRRYEVPWCVTAPVGIPALAALVGARP